MRVFIGHLLIVCLLLFTEHAFAAEAEHAPDCTAIGEAIVDLRTPEYPSGAVWMSAHGSKDADERYAGAMVTESGFVLGVGERIVPGRPEIELLVEMLDDRGRVEWEKVHPVKGLRAIAAVTPGERGVWVMGQRKIGNKRPEIWLGFFDPGGELRHVRAISGQLPLVPNDIIVTGKNSLMVSVSEEERDGRHHSVIYRLDGKGNVTGRNAYAFGLNNTILALSAAGSDAIMAAGSVEADDGRPAGWLMLMNRQGDIVWQRQYARGRAAQFNTVADYTGDYMIAAGQSSPAGGGNRAAWVMVFDRASGEPAWQRYYRGALHYAGRDVLAEGDVFTVLLDTRRPDKSEEELSSRLLVLNGRGNVVGKDFFQNAEGVQSEQLVRGKMGERIIVGSTSTVTRTPISDIPGPPVPGRAQPVPSAEDPGVEIKRSRDLWALAAVPVPAWQDPCKPAPSQAP